MYPELAELLSGIMDTLTAVEARLTTLAGGAVDPELRQLLRGAQRAWQRVAVMAGQQPATMLGDWPPVGSPDAGPLPSLDEPPAR